MAERLRETQSVFSLKISVLVRLAITFEVVWRILVRILNWGVPFLNVYNMCGKMMNSVKLGWYLHVLDS